MSEEEAAELRQITHQLNRLADTFDIFVRAYCLVHGLDLKLLIEDWHAGRPVTRP